MESVGRALTKKLIQEIAGLAQQQLAVAPAAESPGGD